MACAESPAEPEEAVTGTYAEELRAVPPGENYLWWTDRRGHPDASLRVALSILELPAEAPS